MENGSFRRKSQKGLLGDLPSPKLARSSSLTDLVGSVPYQGSYPYTFHYFVLKFRLPFFYLFSDYFLLLLINSESLYSSTSILPCSPMKSATVSVLIFFSFYLFILFISFVLPFILFYFMISSFIFIKSESLYASTSILPRGPIVTSPVASPPKPISQSQPGLGLKQV